MKGVVVGLYAFCFCFALPPWFSGIGGS